MDDSDIKQKLLACKTGLEIRKLRATLDNQTAKRIFTSLDPVDQVAIAFAKYFSAPDRQPGRWDPAWLHVDSEIIDP